MMRIHLRIVIVTLCLAGLISACATRLPLQENQIQPLPSSTPTQGSLTPTARPATATPFALGSPVEEPHLELTIVPYPTPGNTITPWDELVDLSRLKAVRWAVFDGTIQANTREQTTISVSYPHDWIVSQPATHILSIQNEPSEAFSTHQGPFVKLEVLWQKEQPFTDAAHPPARTVLISSERAILWEENRKFGLTIVAIFQRHGAYYSVTGYINRVDKDEYDLYRALILFMISSLSIGG